MKIKLIGARSFSSPPLGIMSPMKLGDVIDIADEAKAKRLLSMKTYDSLNNAHDMFSSDPDAEVTYEPVVKEISLEKALKEQKEESLKRLQEQAKENAEAKQQNSRSRRSRKAPADAEAEVPEKKTAAKKAPTKKAAPKTEAATKEKE